MDKLKDAHQNDGYCSDYDSEEEFGGSLHERLFGTNSIRQEQKTYSNHESKKKHLGGISKFKTFLPNKGSADATKQVINDKNLHNVESKEHDAISTAQLGAGLGSSKAGLGAKTKTSMGSTKIALESITATIGNNTSPKNAKIKSGSLGSLGGLRSLKNAKDSAKALLEAGSEDATAINVAANPETAKSAETDKKDLATKKGGSIYTDNNTKSVTGLPVINPTIESKLDRLEYMIKAAENNNTMLIRKLYTMVSTIGSRLDRIEEALSQIGESKKGTNKK